MNSLNIRLINNITKNKNKNYILVLFPNNPSKLPNNLLKED